MTSPLNEKGLEAIVSAMRAEGMYLGTETAARFVRAYLSATSAPDELEVGKLLWRAEETRADLLTHHRKEAEVVGELADALSQAQSALAAMRGDRDSWQRVAHRAEQVATDNAAQVQRLTEEKEALREALEPFTLKGMTFLHGSSVMTSFKLKDIYAARKAMESGE